MTDLVFVALTLVSFWALILLTAFIDRRSGQ